MAIIFNRKTLGERGLVRNLMLLAAGVAGHYVIHGARTIMLRIKVAIV